jgi:hypothetical protein
VSIPNRVFDAVARDEASYGRHNEPNAVFLIRVAGEYWDDVRDLIERWVDHYPIGARTDLVGRLRSPDNRHFGGAFWELYLHESFIRSDFDVQVHPVVSSGPRPPDFLVTRSHESFYVEATATFGKHAGGKQARLHQVFDAINKIHSPNFFLSIDVHSIGDSALPTKRLRSALESWLASLDPDTIDSTSLLSESGQRFPWQESGWDLLFRPLPVRADARGRGHHPLGMWGPGAAYRLGDSESIRDALKDKGSAYGALDRPLLVAINTSTGFNRDFETMNALYGSAQVQFDMAPSDRPAREVRGSDGYWGQPGGWSHRHVSGVLLGPNISVSIISTVSPTLWLHPSPVAAIPALESWRTAELVVDRIEQSEPRRPVHETFGLPEGWPLSEPFPTTR